MSADNFRHPSKRFNLADISGMCEKPIAAKVIDVEKISPQASPSRASKRMKSSAQKPPAQKKKSSSSFCTSPFVSLSRKAALEKLRHLLNEGVDHVLQASDAEMADIQETIQDIARANEEKEAKWKAEHDELLKLIKTPVDRDQELAKLKVAFDQQEDRIIEEAKMDAVASVLEARLVMAEQAKADGYTCEKWDVETWEANLFALDPKRKPEVAEPSSAADKGKAKVGETPVEEGMAEDGGQ